MKITKRIKALAAGMVAVIAASAAVALNLAAGGNGFKPVQNYLESAYYAMILQGEDTVQKIKRWAAGNPASPVPAKNVVMQLTLPRQAAMRTLCQNSGILLRADKKSVAKILRAGEHRSSG